MADHRHHHRRDAGAHGDEQGGEKPNGKANGHAAPQGDGQASDASAQQGAPQQPASSGGEAQDELQAVRDRHLRLAAEFENYRKRVERERSESWVRAQAELAGRLLEPLDDLQRIADFDPATTPAAALHEGAEMVEKKFLRALEAAGLEEIDAAGMVSFQVEATYRALRKGFRVVEVPIVFTDRTAGQSKMSRAVALEAVWRVPRLRLTALRGKL